MENGQQRMITTYEYGNPEADVVLIQLTGEHELAVLEKRSRKSGNGVPQENGLSGLLRQK